MMDTDQQEYTMAAFEGLRSALSDFLEQECSSLCLDSPTDRHIFLDRLVAWLLKEKTFEGTPEQLLPKARYRAGIRIVDEVTGEHIVTLILQRTTYMADEDFMQLQNWFWATIGRAIRDSQDLARTLAAGGVMVDTGSGEGQGGQQFAT